MSNFRYEIKHIPAGCLCRECQLPSSFTVWILPEEPTWGTTAIFFMMSYRCKHCKYEHMIK